MDLLELDLPRLKQDLNAASFDGTLYDVLSTFWGRFVPLVFSGQISPNVQKEESKANKVLFNPLEHFLCGGDPDEVFGMLKQAENPREICGRVFKAGEPTYSCRECAVDPTCVLCAECFRNSEHKRHKYRMSTSGGGGYCDCGDKEAWKSQPTCDIHRRGAASEKKSSVDSLPGDMQQRASQLFHTILQYSYEVLLWENVDELPGRLQSRSTPPQQHGVPRHLTMLYNDEIHTYDQVTTSLKKAIRCNDQEAMDFATIVDREGRCMVKMGSREECDEVKAIIERPLTSVTRHHSKPLKVLVMTPVLVAHQTFAHKLLAWLQTMFTRSDGLRQLFCDVLLADDPALGKSWAEHIMLLDTELWKGYVNVLYDIAVRQLSHQLIMSAIMLNPDSKKEFAIKFTKLYAALAGAFVKDDHHHEVSVLSESVQLYTVTTLQYLPLSVAFMEDSHNRADSVGQLSLQLFGVASVARLLIAKHNLIEVIVNAFLQLCNIPLNQGKFKFERPERHSATQRSQFIIHDLKYALVTKPAPSDWTPDLHQGFLTGYSSLLTLLSRMQGMDAMIRQVSQHVEFEPEWEPAFGLQLRLADILMLVTEWCGTDAAVLSEAFVTTVEVLCQLQPQSPPREELMVGGHVAQCIRCNNSVQGVSLHLPVTRMLASLCPHLNLHQQPIRALLDSNRVRLEELVDPVMNVLALVAQYQAGMWRRNGYSLISQVIFYQNYKFRAEMFDKDIMLMQTCASLMDPNEFIIRLLNKFGVDHWAEEDYGKSPFDDIARQTTVLAEELLSLLIYVVSERFLPGIGEVDNMAAIRREVIHLLCMQPMTRSEVSKNLPPERYESIVEAVIRDVAVARKPTESTGKVVFELKPELHVEYNPCFYHYNKSEQSKAEEFQRMRKKKAGEDQALPPPVPPPFVAGLEPVVRLLDCDVMVHLLKLVVKRALSKRPKAYSEVQLDRCLHLIGLALHEEKRSFQAGNAASPFSFFTKVTSGHSLLSMLESLAGHPNVFHEAQKDLLTWVIKQFSEVRRLSGGVSSPIEARSSVGLLATEEKARKEKKKKTEQAEKRRNRIMAQMVKMQREFMQENAALFDTVSSELSMSGSEMDVTQMQVEAESSEFPVCLSRNRPPAIVGGVGVRHTCILCQEEQEASVTDRALVYAAYVQKSSVLCKRRAAPPSDMNAYTPLFKTHDSVIGTHVGTCGHAMHADCWQGYFDALFVRDRRRGLLHFRGQRSYDVENLEFLCPLCETLSNTVIPMVPPLASLVREGNDEQSRVENVELSLNDWLDALQKTTLQSLPAADDEVSEEAPSSLNPCPLPFVTQMLAESVARNFQLLYDYVSSEGGRGLSESMTDMLKKFVKDVYSFGLGVPFDDNNERVPVMTWEACAYTFAAIEHGLRDEGKSVFQPLSLRQTECLRSLVRVGAVCSGVCTADTVKRHCVTLLSALLCERPAQRTLYTSAMDLDLFNYLVTVSLSLPALYSDTTTPLRVPVGDLSDLHLLELVYVAHLVQIILALDDSETGDSDPIVFMDSDSDEELRQLSAVVTRIRSYAGLPSLKTYSPWQLHSTISGATLPFLRQCALFFHYLTDVAPGESLTTCALSSEHELLSRYLALPTSISACLAGGWDAASSVSISAASSSLVASSPILARLIHSWCSSSRSSGGSMSSAGEHQVRCLSIDSLLRVNHLVSLPSDYADLVHRAAAFPCPNSVTGDESRTPAMCLVCGTVVCSQSYCCQSRTDDVAMGAAMRHVSSCGISCGIFLRIRDCQLMLLMPNNKGCFYTPPYVDEYGETDQGLRRGNPLALSNEHYKRLQKLWLSHGIQEEIVHHLESSPTLFGFDWLTM